jgi:hypothetical protein
MKGITCSCRRWTMMLPLEDFKEQAVGKHREHLAKAHDTVLSYDAPDPSEHIGALLAKAAELHGD